MRLFWLPTTNFIVAVPFELYYFQEPHVCSRVSLIVFVWSLCGMWTMWGASFVSRLHYMPLLLLLLLLLSIYIFGMCHRIGLLCPVDRKGHCIRAVWYCCGVGFGTACVRSWLRWVPCLLTTEWRVKTASFWVHYEWIGVLLLQFGISFCRISLLLRALVCKSATADHLCEEF
jgi:hypothetical protein